MVAARAAAIRNDSYREHYRARVWPNAELLRDPAAAAEDEGEGAEEE